jgi:hypothetical protein
MNHPSVFSVQRLLVVSLSLVGLASCDYSSTARDTFAKNNTCPPERVSVVARNDMKGSSFQQARGAAPPPDVAADPARLRYWQRQQGEGAVNADRLCGSVYQATGCGKQEFFCCHPEEGVGPMCFDQSTGGPVIINLP